MDGMKKLEITEKDNIKSIVYMLLAAKERGEKVYAEYKGKVLYSELVTISDIYKNEVNDNKKEYLLPVYDGLPVYGNDSKGKKGYVLPALEELPTYGSNNSNNNTNVNGEEQKRNREEEAIKRVPEWINEGKSLIDSSRVAFWQETVMTRSIDLYKGVDLEIFLNIMRRMRNGDNMEDIVASYVRTEYSSMFRAFVNFLIKEFSGRGEEFFRIYDAQMEQPKNVNWDGKNASYKPHNIRRVKSIGKE